MKEIFDRRSIRSFTSQNLDEDTIKELLRGAIAAPSAHKKMNLEFFMSLKTKMSCMNFS